MTTHRRVTAGALAYDFAPDDAPLIAHRDWAINSAQLIDDMTDTPIAAPFQARIVLPGAQDEVRQDGTRVRRLEQNITLKTGPDATFALVARPWLRFTPFAPPPVTVTVAITAQGFLPLSIAFPIASDTRAIAAPAPAVNDRVLTLNTTAGLQLGQTLLFGPQAAPQYVRIETIAGNQLTLAAGIISPQNVGDPVFPDTFTAPPPVVTRLRRAAVQIAGRVMRRNTSTNVSVPIINAPVTVTDFWRTRAAFKASPANGAMTDPNAAARQFAIALTPGALAARTAGAGAGALALPAVPDERLLSRPAAADAARIDVDRAANLQGLPPPPAPLATRLLLIEPDDPVAAEYQTIATLRAIGAPEEPAQLGLEFPLLHGHREGARVARINAPGAPLPATTQVLRDDVAPGDRCLFLDGLAGFLPPAPPPVQPAPPDTLYLTGGGAADEFQRYAHLSVRSDNNGFFRLPPLQRMAHVRLTIDDGGNLLDIYADPEYGEAEHRLDAVYFV